jgi:ABC-type polysaccharide/polyol phosphate transport system ATPase subunit
MGRSHALQDVSLALSSGSVCGVIGRNGAGKSTLLRVMGGSLPPTRGRVAVRGRATLLAPGVGFKKNLSGRENAILGCLAQGLTRQQARDRLSAIVELSGLQEVVDWPLHTYSSGMYSRLALAVSLQASPDLLLVDEALSAGDFAFRSRVDEAVAGLVSRAATVVLISHSFPQIRALCDRCLWVHDGRIEADGAPQDVIIAYRKWVYAQDPQLQGSLPTPGTRPQERGG